MNGILYFSATGNSLYVAKKIKEKIGGEVVNLSGYAGDGSEFDFVVICTPIHSFGLPKIVYDFLPRMNKSKEFVVVQTYGGMVGGADFLAFQLAKENNLNIKGVFTVKMPENYTLFFTVPKFYSKIVLHSSERKIEKIATQIQLGNFKVPKKKKTHRETYLKNMSNWHLIGREFKATEDCVKCQRCVKSCPVGNISLQDGKIVFGDKCVACLACYHRCPQKAIRYKNRKKKYRYIHPQIKESGEFDV